MTDKERKQKIIEEIDDLNAEITEKEERKDYIEDNNAEDEYDPMLDDCNEEVFQNSHYNHNYKRLGREELCTLETEITELEEEIKTLEDEFNEVEE